MTTKLDKQSAGVEMIVLAAGQGTRMKSDLPKVLHPVCGAPMLELLILSLCKAGKKLPGSSINIVVGHKREQIIDKINSMRKAGQLSLPLIFTTQQEQLGTGHAVKLALESSKSTSKNVAVFNGDLPLFDEDAFDEFFEAHLNSKGVATLASMVLRDGAGYGRVLRKKNEFLGVVELKDASPREKAITEVNAGIYFFDRAFLKGTIAKVKSNNKANEFYLPSVFEIGKKQKKKISAFQFKDPSCLLGVNDQRERADAEKVLYHRTAEKWLKAGVSMMDPESSYIGPAVNLASGVSIGPGVLLAGNTEIHERAVIEGYVSISDSKVGEGTVIKTSSVIEKSSIGKNCSIGPMAHFRPGTVVEDQVRIGNFVEVKDSKIQSNSTAAHLSYIGNAEIGKKVNIGCGFITCNYDGRQKHKTIIGDSVFVGSDSQMIAPIEIAEGTYIASGTTVSQSVKEKDSLVIARAKQITRPGYAKKYKK